MADRRRLQGEIDKTLRKVNEGCEAFDDIWIRIQTASNANQKDKYETELKKEIKKLQRLREQIKNWQSSNEIKDKKPLSDARRSIEQQMEKFKENERELKGKAFGKDSRKQELDPEQKEQEELKEWLSDCVISLNAQIETYENKLEDLNANKKKKIDKEKIESIKSRIETHKRHIGTLEKLQEMLTESSISVKKIQDIQEDVEDYIENNEGADFEENIYLFDDLELDKFVSTSKNDTDDELGNISDENNSITDSNSPCESPTPSSNLNNSHQNDEQISNTQPSSTHSSANKSTNNNNTNGSGNNNNNNNRRRYKSESTVNSNQDDSSNSSSKLSNSPATSNSTNTSQQVDSKILNTTSNNNNNTQQRGRTNSNINNSNNNNSNQKLNKNNHNNNNTFIPITTSATTTNTLQTQSITTTTANTINQAPVPISNPTTTAISFSAALTQNKQQQQTVKKSLQTQISADQSVQQYPSTPTANTPSSLQLETTVNSDKSQISPNTSISNHQKQNFETTQPIAIETQPLNGSKTPIDDSNQVSLSTPKSMADLAYEQIQQQSQTTQQTQLMQQQLNPNDLAQLMLYQQQQSNNSQLQIDTNSNRINLPQTSNMSPPGIVINPQQQLINQQQNQTNNETFIQPILGVAPLGKVTLNKDQTQQLEILDSALKKLPIPSDSERNKIYFSRTPVHTPNYYPSVPPPGHDSLDFLCRLSSETLFFMFYYMEGTKAQFLAAQALKKLSWRFHTRYMMWFQRLEEPKVITDDFEQGTYIYFDFEKWAQRKKEGFTFEYKYLEDRDLSSY